MPGGQVFGFEHGGSRRYADLVNRLFQIESADAPMPPGFVLEQDRPEWSFLKRERLWTTGPQGIAAAPGNLGRLQVANPIGSSMLVIVIGAKIISKVATGIARLTLDGAGIVAGILHNVVRDTRSLGTGAVATTAFSTNAVDNTLPAISGTELERVSAPAGGDGVMLTLPVILQPNHRLDIYDGTPNEGATFQMWGYERPFTPDELAL